MPTLLLRTARVLLLLPALPLLLLAPWLLRVWAGLRARTPEPRPVLGRSPRQPPASVTVVIVSWDGRDLLAACLPPLRVALARVAIPARILVVDNGSQDGTVAWLRDQHPDIQVVALPQNVGFGAGNNAALPHVQTDAVLLLNNDMLVEPDFLAPLLAGFRDEDVFAVASQVLQEEGKRREETGNTAGVFQLGEIHWFHDPIPARAEPEFPVLWAGGGAALFDTAKLRALGGFDALFSPAYVEDADLCWCAWQRGWRSLLAPASRVLHRHRSTSARKFHPRALSALVRANQWLFLLKNLTDCDLLRDLLRQLPRNLARDLLQHGLRHQLRVVARVLPRLLAVRRARRATRIVRIPDRAILCLDRRYTMPDAARATGRPRALVLCAYLPRVGVHAGGQRVYRLLERLARSFEITLLSYAETNEEAAAARELGFCAEVEVILRGQSPFEPNRLGLEPPAVVGEFGNPDMKAAVRRHVGSGRYDLVQVEFLQMAFLLPPWHTLPSVLTDHEVQSLAFARLRDAARGLGRLRATLAWLRMLRHERRQARRFDRVVTMTDVDAAALLQLDPRLPVVVNNTGVDTLALRPAPEQDGERIVFVGYFRHQPNLDAMPWLVHEILPRVRAELPGVELTIVGASPPAEIQDLGKLPGITVTGRVPEIAPYVHAAKVFVVPLRDGAGIRGKILEAWALGRAVVTTSVGVAGLHATDGVHLLVADDAATFAAAVVQLLRDGALRARITAQALRRVAADYSWEVKADEHARLWWELLDEAGSAYGSSPWRLRREIA